MSAGQFQAPPVRTPFPDQGSPVLFSRPWIQWYQAITDKFNLLFGTPPVVTGSRGGNIALTNLLSVLNKQGYINDQTTP